MEVRVSKDQDGVWHLGKCGISLNDWLKEGIWRSNNYYKLHGSMTCRRPSVCTKYRCKRALERLYETQQRRD